MNDKQQLAAMGEHIAEQAAQPLCMAKRIEELEAQVRSLTTPEGWQLVPVDPSLEMVTSGLEATIYESDSASCILASAYRAMLAAAPSPDSAK